MYHSLAYSTILFMEAVLTFEQPAIDEAIKSIKKSINLAQSKRRKVGMLQQLAQISQKPDYTAYTHEEIHAELVYAETLLLRAMLTFIQDENLLSFIKGALKIKTCYHSYKECKRIGDVRKNETLREFEHFTSGINMGVGAFNLMISQLPTRVLKLLEFVGFSGNKDVGLKELYAGSSKLQSLRGPLCSLILLTYHTLITYILGTGEGDIEICQQIVKSCLQEYPKSALFLFFAGRIEEINGNIDLAITKLTESMISQSEWKQFHHICYWELMWCYSFKGDWLMAMKFAEKLANENRWSKATYTYLKASFLSLCEETDESRKLVTDLYSSVSTLTQRIAGKSIPIEKFSLKKSKLYRTQNNRLTLPALEMMYVWNGFTVMGRKPELLDNIINLIEHTLTNLNPEMTINYTDNYCLALLLKGVALSYKGQHFQADMCFHEILELENKLKHDFYLAPWTLVERALLNIKLEDFNTAHTMLEAAKTKYKGYLLESRLYFRIHSAMVKVRQVTGKNK